MRAPAFLIGATILVAPVAARAEPPSNNIPAKARMLADRGRAFHDAGDYASAIAAFTQAYVIAPSPALLFNLAQAYRLQGNCDDAALMYRRYLATGPSPEGRTLAETHLANVERCLHKLGPRIPSETTASLAVPPPDRLAMTGPARSHKAQIEKDIGIGLVLGGGAALAIAGYYAVRAHDAANEVEAAYARRAKWSDIAPIDARGKTAARTAKFSAAGGALGIAGGVVMYLIGRHTEQTSTTSMTMAPTSHGAEVSVLWAF